MVLEWTTNRPTEPGFYWITTPYTNTPRVVKVWGYENGSNKEVLFTNEDGGAPVSDKMLYPTGTKFYGPIQPPCQVEKAWESSQ